jgi:hypothetical protein
MKKYLLILALSGLVGFAASDAKVETLTGKAECAKCSLKQTSTCQMALTTKDGKHYLVENNPVSKKFHKNICEESKEVTVTGTVTEKDGKNIIVAKKVELAKKSS